MESKPWFPPHPQGGLPWEGEAPEAFNSRTRAATSRQHSVPVWFALPERQGKGLHEQRTAGLNGTA